MPLITRLTDLKSLNYGRDRRDGGSSGQPYVTTPIPDGEGPGFGDYDFLLRGGSLLPKAVAQDVSRLTQMMFDRKSPNGFLFTVKQNVLSRSGVNIEATSGGKGGGNNRLPLNNGIYLPTSTLAQAAVNPLGGHLLKQGINPFADTNTIANGNILSTGFGASDFLPLSQPIYLDTVAQNERQNPNAGGSSRLIQFTNAFIKDGVRKPDNPGRYVAQDTTELYSYSGGPGSTLGVGKTNISISKDRTGRNNPNLAGENTNLFFINSNDTQKPIVKPTFGTSNGLFGSSFNSTPAFSAALANAGNLNYGREDYSVFIRPSPYYQSAKIFSKTLSTTYQSMGGADLFQLKYTRVNNTSVLNNSEQNVFQTGSFQSNSANVTGLKNTLDYAQLMAAGDSGSIKSTEIKEDFRKNTINPSPTSPSYKSGENFIVDNRVNQGTPGAPFLTPRTSYTVGRGVALDKINALSLYKSDNVDTSKPINDLVKFRIGVIDNEDPNLKTYIHFRAFINSMNDSYNAEWGAQKFTGRAESLYNYQGFDRSVSLSWTVAAQSKQELIPMYQKLNYLASVCAPDYSADGYMRGNLIELTVGGYLYKQVGIMQGITFDIPTDSPWEVAINDNGGFDNNVKELPHRIDVSGFTFKPIHDFVPNVQKNIFKNTNEQGTNTQGDIDIFGDERYIALSNGRYQNYTSDGKGSPVVSENTTNSTTPTNN